MKLSDFYTRERANQGERMPLALPDGTPTDQHLVIRGADSDAVRAAIDDFRRDLLRLSAVEDKAQRAQGEAEARVRFTAAMVVGWSFEEPFTDAALAELLREAPYIADAVQRFSDDRQRFFGKRSASSVASSSPSPSTNSDC